jgi:CRP/FNR family transcriptional regulator
MGTSFTIPLQPSCAAVVCSGCSLRNICLPAGLDRDELQMIDKRLVSSRRRLPRGTTLFQAGDRLDALYAVWTGFFKTSISGRDGRDQVTGFHMGGELLGLDGLETRRHQVDAVSLEDAQVCVIPFDAFSDLTGSIETLRCQAQRMASRELVRCQRQMLVLGSMHAEERLASFLLSLTERLAARGFSASAVVLRMTREEIGSFLGLTLETVSRTFSKFQSEGLLFVRARQLRVTDPVGLQAIVDGVPH